MQSLRQAEKENAEYYDPTNDGSSWLALYDVNGFDETERQIQMIEMRQIYGVKSLQTWLHTGKNVNVIEQRVEKIIEKLLPWFASLINTQTAMSDLKRYEHVYQILQLLKFVCKFKALRSLNISVLSSFYETLLNAITYDNMPALFSQHYKRVLGEMNSVLLTSINYTPPVETLCILIQLLSKCDPTNDSESKKLYAEAISKLIYRLLNKFDRSIMRTDASKIKIFQEIHNFFQMIVYETWQMADSSRRFPLKIIQMVIARIVYYSGHETAQLLEEAMQQLQQNQNVMNNYNTSALEQYKPLRESYAKKLILNFIQACENRRYQQLNPGKMKEVPKPHSEYDGMPHRPDNIYQAQSAVPNQNFNRNAGSTNTAFQQAAPSQIPRARREPSVQAQQYAKSNAIDLNFSIWAGMTGRDRRQRNNFSTFNRF
jgi:hypothetical protein